MELQDPDVFEVLLMGNNMLPLVKRRCEFEQLSQALQRVQSGTPPLRINQQDPTLTAQDIQIFLDGLLFAIGLDEDSSPHCQLLKSFLGLWRSNDVDHFRANSDGTGFPPLLLSTTRDRALNPGVLRMHERTDDQI